MPDKIHWTLVEASLFSPGKSSEFLSPAELRKLSLLRFPKRRSEWLLGRWTAKSLVQSLPAYRYYSLDKIEIRNTPQGVPRIYLPEGSISRDCLSISHRDDLAFCALALGPDLKIGADLEKIEPRAGNFAEDYFTQAEQRLVGSHPVEIRAILTTLIWSAKEAMLKALGVGLRWDTRQVEISAVNGLDAPPGEWQKIQVVTRPEDRHWSARWQRRGDFILTLAGSSSKPANLRIVEKKLYLGRSGSGT
jgi:4'-phosphopantetheinyl transferase